MELTRHGNPTCELNTSELSVQAGPPQFASTPKDDGFTRPDSFFSTFSNMKDEVSDRGTPDFLKQIERDVNFEMLAKQHADTEASRPKHLDMGTIMHIEHQKEIAN